MKYATEITIHLPREKVVGLFDNHDNLYKWQAGLKNHSVTEGTPGKKGCRSELVYEGRKGDLVMTETVILNDLPEAFHVEYRTKGVYNEMQSRFEEAGPERTVWHAENLFRFRGLMALMAPFLKNAFRSNTILNMERFKTFAENEFPSN